MNQSNVRCSSGSRTTTIEGSRTGGTFRRGVALLVAVLLGACGGSDPSGPNGSIQLQLNDANLVPGQSAQLVATAVDASGNPLSGTPFRYASGTPSVVSVSASGALSALSVGTSTITVSADGLSSATQRVTVLDGAWVTASGGSFSAFGGALQLTIPAGAVTTSQAVTVSVGLIPFPDPTTVVGSVYQIGNGSTTFGTPVIIRIAFNASNGPFGLPINGFGIRRLNGSVWDDRGGSIEQNGSVALASIDVGGTYAVGRVRPAVSCTGAAYRAFDFWLGDWDVGTGGAPFGRNVVTLEPGGCAVFEHYTDQGGTNGYSVNFYEPVSAQWYQTYVDATPNGRIVLSGPLSVPGRLEMKTVGATAYQRWVWTLHSPNYLTQVGSITTDGGNTFATPFWNGQYVRRP